MRNLNECEITMKGEGRRKSRIIIMFPNWPAPSRGERYISRRIYPISDETSEHQFSLFTLERCICCVVCCEFNIISRALSPRISWRRRERKKNTSKIYRINWFKSLFWSSSARCSADCGAITTSFVDMWSDSVAQATHNKKKREIIK